jgi:hypothetical protein
MMPHAATMAPSACGDGYYRCGGSSNHQLKGRIETAHDGEPKPMACGKRRRSPTEEEAPLKEPFQRRSLSK